MPGSTKKRARTLRKQGNHDLADWLEEREKARAEGATLWEWDRDHPKPGGDPAKLPKSKLIFQENEINHFRNSEDLKKKYKIPPYEKDILDKIIKNKAEMKKKAIDAGARESEAELKTIYKVLKRLDNEEKKIIYKYDFAAFDRDFFKDIQDRVDTAPFHFEMISMYEANPRSCVVCPRGHAKSTIARKYILHQILYQTTSYTIIVGASEDMAAQNLRWVRDQLTDNPLVLEIYGYLKNKDKWADTEFQTNNGIKVVAKGAGQKIRGANEKGRPDFIYIDDLEEDEQVSSKDRRAKLRKWFTQALLPAKSRKGRIIITGTILHLDSLLKNISENKVKDHLPWQVLWYEAISKGDDGNEKALWEEHKPLSELRTLRETDPETFAQEYQNNPTSGAMAVFTREEYKYMDPEDIRFDKAKSKIYVKEKLVNVLLTIDLAISEREGADYTVFKITGMDENSNLYVLEYERFRTSDPYEQIDMIFYLLKKWHADMLTMEQVAFQKTFKRILEYEMKERDIFPWVHEVSRQQIRKIFRIKSLRAPIKAGKIVWQHDHIDLEEELSQVSATSLGKHDDVIDCLADAWEVQVELSEDRDGPTAPINSVEWLIEQNMFPTCVEQEEMHFMEVKYG